MFKNNEKKNFLFRGIKAQSLPKKLIFTFLLLLLIGMGVWFVMGQVYVNQVSPSTSWFNTSSPSFPFNFSIENNNLQNLTLNFGVSSYSIHNQNVILLMNFNNLSSLGESDAKVYDLSSGGNNGTVTNATWTPDGKYGGGFHFNGSNISMDIITLPASFNTQFNQFSNFTISAWIKPYKVTGEQTTSNDERILGFYGYNSVNWKSSTNATWMTIDYINTSGTYTTSTSVSSNANSVPSGVWSFITFTKSGNNFSVYVNGVYQASIVLSTFANLTEHSFTERVIGSSPAYKVSAHGMAYNGTIDELRVENASLINGQVKQLYYSYLSKDNSTHWNLYSNETLDYSTSNINYTNPTKNYNYSVCSYNLTNEVCSSQNLLTQTIPNKTITVNFSNLIGTLRDDVYGANTHSRSLSKGYTINMFQFGGLQPANYTWRRNVWLDAGLKNQRWDMYLSSYYQYITNLDFERWTNLSYGNYTGYLADVGCIGWGATTYAGNGSVHSSNDTHSGNYSLNLTNIGVSGNVFLIKQINTLPNGLYTVRAWIKTNTTGISILVYNMTAPAYTIFNSSAITSTGDWQQVEITLNLTNTNNQHVNAYGFYIISGMPSGGSVLVDDVSFYYNGNKQNYFPIKSFENLTEQAQWAFENNQKVYFLTDSFASYFGNNPCYTSSNLSYCTGSIDYDETYLPMIIDWVNKTTDNGKYLSVFGAEVSNEPYYYDGWYANISDDNIAGSIEYMRKFNSTIFNLKRAYPTLPVGGPSGFRNAPNLTRTFLSNMSLMSYPADFHSLHPYGYTKVNGLEQYVDTMNYLNNCSFYGVNCSHMLLSEISVGDTAMKSSSTYALWYKLSWVQSYISLFNSFPSYVSLDIYQFSENNPYSIGNLSYAEFPSKWHMIQDINYNSTDSGELTGGYNATKLTSTVCPAGSNIKESNFDNTTFTVTSCQKGSIYGIIVGNINITNSQNIIVNLSLDNGSVYYPYPNITNLETKEVYNVVAGIVQLNSKSIMDAPILGGQNNLLFLLSGIPPTISSIQPANLTINTTSQNISFSANLTDDVGLINSTLNILNTSDNTLIQSVVNYVSGEISVIQSWLVSLADGIYHWWISLFDDEGKETISGNYTETIAVPPTFTTIPNNQTIQYGNESLLVIFTGTDETAFDTYSVNDSRFSINDTGFLINITNTPVGNYSMNITINDTHNNINWTIFTLEVIDTIFPTISFEPQTTNSSNFSQSNIYLNVTTSDLSNHSVLQP